MKSIQMDLHHLAQEAAVRERSSRRYVLVTSALILLAAFEFIWLTWRW